MEVGGGGETVSALPTRPPPGREVCSAPLSAYTRTSVLPPRTIPSLWRGRELHVDGCLYGHLQTPDPGTPSVRWPPSRRTETALLHQQSLSPAQNRKFLLSLNPVAQWRYLVSSGQGGQLPAE